MNSKTSKGQARTLRRSAVAQACITATLLLAAGASQAASGWGDSFDNAGKPIRVRTYYAHSPSGARANDVVDDKGNVVARKGDSTGAALRKFVDNCRD